MTGKVFLVGGGPGDPELLTLKAARVLRTAEVVLHDDLISDEVLRLVPPHALIHNVGKRSGKKNISQDEINFLMVTLAQSGSQVVRLKGGDPLIFGRAAEEIAALRKANIEFEIVPGITAALGAAASAQVPLTNRNSSHALVLVAGHTAAGTDPTDWPSLVSSGATVVVYMPGQRYAETAQKLRTAGLPYDTPCLLISQATRTKEEFYSTTLGKLSRAPRLAAPTLLVVGEVLHTMPRSSTEVFTSANGWPWIKSPLVMQTASELPASSTSGLGFQEPER